MAAHVIALGMEPTTIRRSRMNNPRTFIAIVIILLPTYQLTAQDLGFDNTRLCLILLLSGSMSQRLIEKKIATLALSNLGQSISLGEWIEIFSSILKYFGPPNIV